MWKFSLLVALSHFIVTVISLTISMGILNDQNDPLIIESGNSVFVAKFKPLKLFSKGDVSWNMCTWAFPDASYEPCVYVELDTDATQCSAPMSISKENDRCILNTVSLDGVPFEGTWASEIRSTSTNNSNWGIIEIQQVKEPEVSLNFESGSSNFQLAEALEITCEAHAGQPKPNLRWFLDDQDVTDDAPPQDDSQCNDPLNQCLVSSSYSLAGSAQIDGSFLACRAQQLDFLGHFIETNDEVLLQLDSDARTGLDTWAIVGIVLGCLLLLLLILLLVLAFCLGWCCFAGRRDKKSVAPLFVEEEPYHEQKDNMAYWHEDNSSSTVLRQAQIQEIDFQKAQVAEPWHSLAVQSIRNDWLDSAQDELKDYRYEGQGQRRGSVAASLSSLETVSHYDNIDFEKYFRPLGAPFEKLANLYDRRKSVWPEYDSDWSHISDIPFEESVI